MEDNKTFKKEAQKIFFAIQKTFNSNDEFKENQTCKSLNKLISN